MGLSDFRILRLGWTRFDLRRQSLAKPVIVEQEMHALRCPLRDFYVHVFEAVPTSQEHRHPVGNRRDNPCARET